MAVWDHFMVYAVLTKIVVANDCNIPLPTIPDFSYVLSSHPPSLFDNTHMMRESQKSGLDDVIWSKPPDSHLQNLQSVSDTTYILDSESLVHQIPWPRGFPSYRELCGEEIRAASCRLWWVWRICYKVQRRACGKVGAEVRFSDEMKITQKKGEFLSNSMNKQRFINMLSTYLQLLGCKVHHARGDAAFLIVTTAIQCSVSNTTVVVGVDTDLLVLLCFYVDPEVHGIFMYSQNRSSTNQTRMWNIQTIHSHLGANVCAALLIIHAVERCDTTSRLYGIDKGYVLKKFLSSKVLQNIPTLLWNNLYRLERGRLWYFMVGSSVITWMDSSAYSSIS